MVVGLELANIVHLGNDEGGGCGQWKRRESLNGPWGSSMGSTFAERADLMGCVREGECFLVGRDGSVRFAVSSLDAAARPTHGPGAESVVERGGMQHGGEKHRIARER